MLSLSANEQRFYPYARYSICLEMSWITVIYEKYIELNSTAQVKITFRIVQARDTPMHAHSHITWAVAATDSCLAFIGAHQHGIAVRSMNRKNPCLKDPLLPQGECKALL